MPSRCVAALTGAFLALAMLVSPAIAARDDLNLGMVLEPPHLDPTAGAPAAIDEVVYANVFEGLTRIGPAGEILPALARAWTVSEDGLEYKFDLQTDVLFHDGTPFDSKDVVFSIERARAETSENAQKGLFEQIDTVEALDASTVLVKLAQPQGSFLFNLGWGDAVIVAPESADANKTTPVGTGPFKFERWVKGSSLTLVRNTGYWGTPPALAKVSFKFIPDAAAAMLAMQAGDVDAFPNFPAPEAIAQLQADPRFTVELGTTEGETVLAINNTRPPFDDVRVRRAIAHAIDRRAIIDGAMFGLGTPIGSHFAPHHPAYLDLTGVYEHDPQKARDLLAAAGHANGIRATLKLPPPSYARRGGEILAAQLRDVGIDLNIVPVEWGVWVPEVFTGKDYELTIVSHTEPMDIGIYGRDDYYFGYQSRELNEVLETLETASDETRRNDLLRQAQKIVADDSVNGFLFQLAKAGVWDRRLTGLWSNSPIQANDVTKVRWTD